MEAYPHVYTVAANSEAGHVRLQSKGLDDLVTAPPAEFDGPGDLWSPETLMIAAIADCFILSFRAIAAASRFDYRDISCEVEGTLDRIDKVTSFTEIRVKARLKLIDSGDHDRGVKLLEKAEHNCLITNSMKAQLFLETEVS